MCMHYNVKIIQVNMKLRHLNSHGNKELVRVSKKCEIINYQPKFFSCTLTCQNVLN